jgi:hypothetical protein
MHQTSGVLKDRGALQGDNTMTSDNVVARQWLKANLYCCTCNYPDLLSSLGSALGYSGYIEAVATLVVLLVYLQMVRAGEQQNCLRQHCWCCLCGVLKMLSFVLRYWSAVAYSSMWLTAACT